MALQFLDSFDHYATGDVTEKWSAFTAVLGSQAISAGAGRRGSNAWLGDSSRGLLKAVPAHATMIIGRALAMGGAPISANPITEFREAGTAHVILRLNTDLSVSVLRGPGTVLATSAAGVITTSGYCFLEFKAVINDTTGSYEVRVNGATVLSGSGADTRNAGSGVVTSVAVIAVRSGELWDDLYICDGSGSVNNDFLGDKRVDCYFPNGNGNSSQLVGSDGNSTDNYLLVDEAAPNDDTDYVQSSTVSNKDTYSFQNMVHTPATISGVQILISAKKDDSGSRSVASVIRSGGSDTDGTTQALSTSYAYYMQIAETDPNTAAAWTQSGFDAAEFGAKVAA